MKINVRKTLTEHMNGRLADSSYPTGYKRRTGSEAVMVKGKRKVVTLYGEAPAPRIFDYGSPEHIAAGGFSGGLSGTAIDGVEPARLNLDASEVEMLVRHYAEVFSRGMSIAAGSTHAYGRFYDYSPAQGFAEARMAAARVKALVGFDLFDTNLSITFEEMCNRRVEHERTAVTASA